MAYITLDTNKLRHNYDYLKQLFKENDIEWAVVSKLLCGNKLFLEALLTLDIKQLCDSRVSNLKAIKKIAPNVETIYIKPTPMHAVPEVVQYADISFNTEYRTLQALSTEAGKQGKLHKVVIMVELGELREGVMRDNIVPFYEKVFQLPHIKVVGVGTNFTCLSGVLPNRDKLNQLVLYRELLVAKFNRAIPYVSGGASVTIPLLLTNEIPRGINHFRVGETLFFGTDVYHSTPLPDMYADVICLFTQIIELIKKHLIPDGELGNNLEGYTPEFDKDDCGRSSYRAILDVGLLDVECAHLIPADPTIDCTGASSDMLIVNLGSNPNNYKVGDHIEFRMDYMGALRLMHSRYIKKIISPTPTL